MTKVVQPIYELKPEDYLKLWNDFQNRADNVKEAMFKTVTWTIGLAAVILGFIFANLARFEHDKAAVALSLLVFIAAAAGLVICAYSWLALVEGAKHLNNNWDRAKRCEEHVKDLRLVIQGNGTKEKESMPIWRQLQIIVALFAIAFIGLLGLAVWWLAASTA